MVEAAALVVGGRHNGLGSSDLAAILQGMGIETLIPARSPDERMAERGRPVIAFAGPVSRTPFSKTISA